MKPKVLLAYPSSYNCSIGIDDVDIKTSLLILGSFLVKEYPITYMDFELAIGRPNSPTQIKRFERKVRQYFEENEFDVLGLSCWTSMSYLATLSVAKIFRELYPDKLIVVGGYHPTARPEEFIFDEQLFDYIVTGEGETAFKKILDEYKNNQRPDKTIQVRGTLTSTEHFVPYDWSLVDTFVKTYIPEGINKLYIYLSRGCPFDCSFCMEALKDRKWRALSPTEAFNQLVDAVERFKPKIVGFADACFGMRPKWRKEFLKLLKEYNPEYQIIFETRVEYLDLEDIDLLEGLNVEVQFGIESGSSKILKMMHKTKQPDKYLSRFDSISRELSNRNILHRANIIFNHPGETESTLQETFTFIDKMLEIDNSYLMWICRPYMHYPGCELDINRTYYEQNFGTRFFQPEWWKEYKDQYMASLDSVPSQELSNGKKELWGDLLTEREETFKNRLSTEAFVYAAEKYFPAWLDDPRYKNL